MNIFEKLYYKIPYNIRPPVIYRWCLYFFWYRYHIIKPRYLSVGWHDKDSLLENAVFETVTKFVEDELPYSNFDYNTEHHKTHIRGREECDIDVLKAVANWWKFYNEEDPKLYDKLWAQLRKLECELGFIPIKGSENYELKMIGNEDHFARHDYIFKKIHEFDNHRAKEVDENLKYAIELRELMWT